MKHPFLKVNGVLVSDPWNPLDYTVAKTCSTNEGALEKWESHYEKLKPIIKDSCADIEQEDIVYVVASGPSVAKNIHELKGIKHGKVMGLNITPKMTKCDYFASMDYSIKPEACFNGDEKMVGLFSPQVNYEIPYADVFSRRLWGIPALVLPLFDRIRKDFPYLPQLTTSPNTSFMALEWLVRYVKPKMIVLIGFDFCGHIMKDVETCRMHPDGHDDFKPEGDWKQFATLGIDGEPVLYIDLYRRILQHHIPFFWFCIDHGIKIVNATEGGLLWENCTCMKLKTAVAMCNLFGESKDESILPEQKTETTAITDEKNDSLLSFLEKMKGEEDGNCNSEARTPEAVGNTH